MIKKINVIKTNLLFMALLLLLSAAESHAFFYRPAGAVRIFSEYKAFNDSAPPRTQVWKVVPEVATDSAVRLRFFTEAAAETNAVCEIELPPVDYAGEIRWKGIGKSGEKESETGLLLAPGFPAPCDVLPIGEEDEREYQEKTEAGGSVFIRTYQVSSATFSLEEANEKGWIKAETKGISELILVTVTDEKGQLAARQLWAPGGSWWLYEETPLRRSWRID
jgi:hypothetical protein